MSDRRILVSGSDGGFAEAAATVLRSLLDQRLEVAERATVALAGGSTPLPVYRALAPHAIDWSRLELFFGDERAVPRESSQSNYRAVTPALGRIVESALLYRIPGELGARRAAAAYHAALRERFGASLPRFDLVLLGLGSDGHTASLFPGSPALPQVDKGERLAVATRSPVEPRQRISLSLEVLNAAKAVVFLVTGEEKAAVVRRVLDEDPALPAARVVPREGSVTWILDPPAARLVESAETIERPATEPGR